MISEKTIQMEQEKKVSETSIRTFLRLVLSSRPCLLCQQIIRNGNITVKCNISLTDEYVQDRIKALCNHEDKHTKQFIDLYGTDQHALTLVGLGKRLMNLTKITFFY